MRVRRLMGYLAAALCTFSWPAFSQEIPVKKTIDQSAIAAIPEQVVEDYYLKARAALRENAPRLVLVPGILGSKIIECRVDDSECRPIWGTSASIVDKTVDLSFRTDRKYRTDVVDRVFFQDIYGSTLDFIHARIDRIVAETSSDPLLTVFHYDWRRSNGDSAERLAERICAVRDAAPKSPIILIGHSMGGLVSKIWLKRHAQQACKSGAQPNISSVVFVATPHLGSPKTIKAIAEGYNVLFDELSGLSKYLGFLQRVTAYWERTHLLQAINAAGMTYPSFYELLPIQTSEFCRESKPDLAAVPSPFEGDDGKPLNAFDVQNWRRYDFLRRIGAPGIREVFYQDRLATYLLKAEQLLCEIADFDPAKVANVTYIIGREKEDKTYGWFRLRPGDNPIEKVTSVAGDGTVPIYSAQNTLVSLSKQIRETTFGHVNVIASPLILNMVDDWYAQAITRTKLGLVKENAQFKQLAVTEIAGSGALLPVSLDAREWGSAESALILAVNSEALKLMEYSPADVARAAASNTDAEQRAKLYAVAAATAGTTPEKLKWTAEVARSAYVSGRFEDAKGSADYLVAAVKTQGNAGNVEFTSLEKQAKEVTGWAKLRQGDVNAFNVLAQEYATAGTQLKEPSLPSIAVVPLFGKGGKIGTWAYQPAPGDFEFQGNDDVWTGIPTPGNAPYVMRRWPPS